MGIFDIFKSPEEKKRQETINNLFKEIFPGGNPQMNAEIQEVRQLLGFKYSKESIQKTYVFAVITTFTSSDKSLNNVVGAILRNSDTSVTREDAEKIFYYIQNKRFHNSNKPLSETLTSQSDGEKLFMIVFGAIVEIKKAYKDLTPKGKFEVLLFNSLIALQEYQSNHPEKYESIQEDFFKKVFAQSKVFCIDMPAQDLAEFVNSRFETYLEELLRFFEDEESGYMLLKVYSLFYEQPLARNPETSFDLFEYPLFLPAVIKMRNYVIEKTNNIF